MNDLDVVMERSHHHKSLDPAYLPTELGYLCRASSISTTRMQNALAGRSRLAPHDEGVDIWSPLEKAVVGILAKYRHGALKHSRLSDPIDFVRGRHGVLVYLNAGMPNLAFDDLKSNRQDGMRQSQLDNKGRDCDKSILKAFVQEAASTTRLLD